MVLQEGTVASSDEETEAQRAPSDLPAIPQCISRGVGIPASPGFTVLPLLCFHCFIALQISRNPKGVGTGCHTPFPHLQAFAQSVPVPRSITSSISGNSVFACGSNYHPGDRARLLFSSL